MLLRKMFRDIKGNMVQFVSIFLMTFLGIFIFTGMNAVGEGMNQSSQRFYEKTNLADAFIYGINFTEDDLMRLKAASGVDNAEGRLQLNAALEKDAKKTLQLNVVESNQISSNYLVTGEAFAPEADGIWLDSSFAKANSVKVGDLISFRVKGEAMTKTVKGLIMNPEYVYALKDDNELMPDHKNFGFAFLPANGFMKNQELTYNQLLMKSGAGKAGLEDIKTNLFEDKQALLLMREDQPSVRMFQEEINQTRAMQAIFPMAFLLIAILTTLTTMTRITVNQRTQIGTLKAIGFSSRKIAGHYISYGALAGTASGVLGIITGPFLLPGLTFRFQKEFYTLPEWRGELKPVAFGIVIACIICCGLSGYFTSCKELRGVTAQILRPKAPKTGRLTKFEKSGWWQRLKFDYQWNIRDLLRNKLRSAITVFGIIGCMVLIICAFGLRDTVQGITDITYKEINTYNLKVTLPENLTPEKLSELQSSTRRQFMQEAAIEIDLGVNRESTMITVLGEGDYLRFKDRDNRAVTLPAAGITLTNKLAKRYHLETGDTLKWRFYGTKEWNAGEITQIIRNPVNQGMFVNREAYESMNKVMQPTAFLTDEQADAFRREDFSFIQSRKDLIETMEAMMETMNAIIVIMVLAAVVLGAVVLYNLGVLSFNEKLRELTTLRVLGFQHGMLGKLLQLQNLWLTLSGALIGIPGGYLLLSYMLRFMGDNYDLLPNITIQSYAYSILGTLLLSMIVNLLLSRKLKSLDMISALKAVE